MITIEQEKCTHCGLCADICHEGCISINSQGLNIDNVFCSTCTQCVAVCPRLALAWEHVPSARFERKLLPGPEQLDELFKERRSIRRFKKTKIDRTLLEEIAQCGAYAPTHNFNLRVIVVDDEELIASLSQAVLDYCRWIYRLAYKNKIFAWLAGLLGYANEMNKARPKIEAALREGRTFHSMPTALLFIVGDRKVPLSAASAQYALANMIFYAQVKGIGTCLWGNGPIFIDKNRASRQRIGLEQREKIYGAMYMGYPAIRFQNKASGKCLPIQWNIGKPAADPFAT